MQGLLGSILALQLGRMVKIYRLNRISTQPQVTKIARIKVETVLPLLCHWAMSTWWRMTKIHHENVTAISRRRSLAPCGTYIFVVSLL